MSRKPIPAEAFDHGDPRRYHRGCRCRPCTTGVSAEVRRRSYLRATGRGLLTTCDRAATHIERLRAAGMTDAQILNDALLVPHVLYRILRRDGGLHRTTEARILAVRPTARTSKGSGAHVAALGTVRRLRALAADGWPAAELGRRAGKHKQFIVYLQKMDEGGQVRMWVADYVRRLQESLALLAADEAVPTHIARRTRQRAAAKGWVGSGYWDDEDFDNPNFTPATDRTPRYIELAENGHELERIEGLTRKQAAARLGVTKSALQQAMCRYRAAQAEQQQTAA